MQKENKKACTYNISLGTIERMDRIVKSKKKFRSKAHFVEMALDDLIRKELQQQVDELGDRLAVNHARLNPPEQSGKEE